jgi:cytoskeletal protein RodZ
MQSLGEKVRREREARNTTIEEISAATGIDRGYLEALEKNEFQALPGPAFGKLYIRAYAETLGFDPRSLLEAYDREQRAGAPPSETASPGAIQQRPVEAEIARWRETMVSRRSRSRPGAPTIEDGEASAGEATEAVQEIEEKMEKRVEATRPERPESSPEIAAEIEGPSSATSARRPHRRIVPALAIVGLSLGAAAIYVLMQRTANETAGPVSSVEPTHTIPRADPLPPPPKEEPPATRPAERPAPPPVKTAPAAEISSHLSVAEFGVGRRIVDRRLEDQDERFAKGEVVSFSTRVVGGKRGEFIRHVWLHEGRVKQSIRLRLGGADWRTHSNRTVGETGEWAAEARDDRGRVLARATFTSAPANQ